MHQANAAPITGPHFDASNKLPSDIARRSVLAGAVTAASLATVLPFGGAEAAPADSSEWDKLMIALCLKTALRKADEGFGALAKANREHDDLYMPLKSKYGIHGIKEGCSATELEALRASRDRSDEAANQHYDRYYIPENNAAIAVVMSPAPNVEALLDKIRLVVEYDLDSDRDMKRDPMEIVLEDVRRLGA